MTPGICDVKSDDFFLCCVFMSLAELRHPLSQLLTAVRAV